MKSKLMPYLLLTPFLLLMLVLLCGVANAVVQSFGIIPAFGMTKPTLKYYIEVFTNHNLLSSIGFSLWISLISSILAIVFGIFLCFAIVTIKKSKGLSLNIIQLPIMIPHMVVSLFVISIFSQSGLLARVLYHLGILSSPKLMPNLLYGRFGIGIILAYLWKEIPFVCYFVISIMSNISNTLDEAAVNLGATRMKSFFSVTLPLCMPTIKNAFLIIFAFSFGAYELPYLLGSTLPKALPVQAYIEYINPDLRHRPYAMVLNVVMIAFSLIICYFYNRFSKDKGKEGMAKE